MIVKYSHINIENSLESCDIKTAIDSKDKKDNLLFYENEISFRSDGLEILSYARPKVLRIKVLSDGKIFSNQEVANVYLREGAHIFEIASDFTKEKELVFQGIRNLRNSSFFDKFKKTRKAYIEARVIVNKDNVKELESTVRQLLSLGINRIILENQLLTNNVEENILFKKIIDISLENNIWILTEGIPLCLMKEYESHVIELYKEEKDYKKLSSCKKCVYRNVCKGVLVNFYNNKGSHKNFTPVKQSKHLKDIKELQNKTEKQKVILTTINLSNELPLAIYYLKAYAMKFRDIKNNYDIIIKDFQKQDSFDKIIKELLADNPSIIGFSCYIWNINNILKIVREIKKENKNIKIWLGGPDMDEEYLKEDVNLLLFGEGEETFSELLRNNLGHIDLSKIKGIIYKNNNQIMKNSSRPLIKDINEIPSPFLTEVADLNTIQKYGYIIFETRRGCVFKCSFCKESVKSHVTRYFSLERIEKELDFLLKNNLFVEIIDPFFNTTKERTLELCRIIEKNNKNNIVWVPLVYYSLDKEIVEGLKKANINRVEIGLQSIHKETLKNVDKFVNLKKFREAISLFDDYFTVHIDLICGLPGDNFFKYLASLKFACSLNTKILAELLSVDNGTPLRDRAEEFKMSYEKEAPYYIINNYSFPRVEIKKAMIMTKSLLEEYSVDL